jgi:hypothetical protein
MVAVQQGTAVVTGPNGVQEVESGTTVRLPVAAQAAAKGSANPQARAIPSELRQLQEENAQLREALQAAELSAAFSRGQLEQAVGEESTWPSEVDPAFSQDGTKAALAALTEEFPFLSVAQVDCSEFPCVARLNFDSAKVDATSLEGIGDAYQDLHGEDAGGIYMAVGAGEGEESAPGKVILSVTPASQHNEVSQRTYSRVQEMYQSE